MEFLKIILQTGLEPDGFGTGAAVADIDEWYFRITSFSW